MDRKPTIQLSQYPEVGSPDVRKKIGEELKNAREFNEMTLDQVRAITKINPVYLEFLEAANWSFLPAVYVKLFIKAYAEVAGIYDEKFQNRLDEIFQTIKIDDYTAEPEDFFKESVGTQVHTRGTGFGSWIEKNRGLFIPSLVVIVAIVIILVYLLKPATEQTPVDQAVITPPTNPQVSETQIIDGNDIVEDQSGQNNDDNAVHTEEIDLGEAQPIVEEIEPQAVVIEKFKLGILAGGTCYVKIEHEDSVLYDRTLWPDNELEIELPEPIKLTLGNAPVVRVLIEGDTLDAFPEDRKVRVFSINSEGIIR